MAHKWSGALEEEKPLVLAGKRVTVMGLGVHGGGLGVARYLVSQGALVTVTDLKTEDQLRSSVEALRGLPVQLVLGQHRMEDFRGVDMVVRNPAVPADSLYLAIAKEHGVAVEMEMGLFFRLCPAPIVGITGTKGKTTTTLLVGAMLRSVEPQTVVAGNLRISALELLPRITWQTPVVLELSSWQLEGIVSDRRSPHIAAVTNVSPDHLNRYRGFTEYVAAKAAIFQFQKAEDFLVLNHDDPVTRGFAASAHGQVVWFSQDKPVSGAYWRDGGCYWRPGRQAKLVCSEGDVHLPGRHNLENVAAAVAVAGTWGVPVATMARAIRGFRGLEGRLEYLGQSDGVSYYNDTTATAPASTIAALSCFDRPVVLIAGGADKALDFKALGRAIADRASWLVLLEGSATDKLEAAVREALDSGGAVQLAGRFDTLVAAVDKAHELAKPGGAVLLSPGCASFGMFANEFDRGEQFKAIVMAMMGAKVVQEFNS